METKKEEKNQCMIQQHNIQGSLFGRDIKMYSSIMFCWASLLVRAPDSWSKGVSSNPGRSGGIIFFSRVNSVCGLLFVSVPTLFLQWHIKDPGHSAKSAGGRLHLNLHTPLTQQSQSGLTMPLCRHSVGTYQETSSHATCHGTLGHSRLSSLSHCGLILA